ncbi:MAG: hypothetical protein GY820_31300 [Gammaproteobacteria bacterium]|nr:hypothetical protein [Gammaproteobacteria bacterium]
MSTIFSLLVGRGGGEGVPNPIRVWGGHQEGRGGVPSLPSVISYARRLPPRYA